MKKALILFVALLLITGSYATAAVNIIPQPTKVVENEGVFNLKNGQVIGVGNPALNNAANYLRRILTRATGYRIQTRKGTGQINLVLQTPRNEQNESYNLSVTSKSVTIKSHSYRGIINGIATLRQLLPDEIESREIVSGISWTIPAVQITDKPNFAWRGLMLDPVRHFYTVEETERFLDQMALYKYNKFHWHLTDAQAWRIEIKKYPLLTQKGAWRKLLSDIDLGCLNRAKSENNPTLLLPKKNFKVENGDSLYGGFYTQEEIKEIVHFAAVRGIDVIPELDMPGHNWIATQCYPWLSCSKDGNDPLCLGKETTLEYCKNMK